MPLWDVVQQRIVDFSLRHQLFDAGQVFVPPDAGGDGNEVFGTENVCRYAFVFYQLSTFFRRTRTQ